MANVKEPASVRYLPRAVFPARNIGTRQLGPTRARDLV
jgi:hypothetical protein